MDCQLIHPFFIGAGAIIAASMAIGLEGYKNVTAQVTNHPNQEYHGQGQQQAAAASWIGTIQVLSIAVGMILV